MNLLEIYKRLYEYFGPQHWWPVTQELGIKNQELRRFEICVGAILTQNTAWKNVEKAIANLHTAKALGANIILKMPENKLAALIRPAGYYNQKAKKLKIFSKWFLKNKTAKREKLLSLWGIGPETADSILLYAFGKPNFVVDAYTKRLCSCLGINFQTYDEYQHFFESQLPRNKKLYNEFHALIVAWGKLCIKDKISARSVLGIK